MSKRTIKDWIVGVYSPASLHRKPAGTHYDSEWAWYRDNSCSKLVGWEYSAEMTKYKRVKGKVCNKINT